MDTQNRRAIGIVVGIIGVLILTAFVLLILGTRGMSAADYKALEARIEALETDNETNKAAIAELKDKLDKIKDGCCCEDCLKDLEARIKYLEEHPCEGCEICEGDPCAHCSKCNPGSNTGGKKDDTGGKKDDDTGDKKKDDTGGGEGGNTEKTPSDPGGYQGGGEGGNTEKTPSDPGGYQGKGGGEGGNTEKTPSDPGGYQGGKTDSGEGTPSDPDGDGKPNEPVAYQGKKDSSGGAVIDLRVGKSGGANVDNEGNGQTIDLRTGRGGAVTPTEPTSNSDGLSEPNAYEGR